MNRAAETIGKTFNRLTVMSISHQDRYGNFHFWCKCSCGKEITANGHKIRTGRTRSCGCLQKERTAQTKAKYIDLIGKRFGKLVIEKEVSRRKNKHNQPVILYKCRCDCGKEKVVRHSSFLPGARKTQSCGCLAGERSSAVCKSWINEDLKRFSDRVRGRVKGCFDARGFPKKRSSEKLLKCSIEDFVEYIKSQFSSEMTWGNYGNKTGNWSLDHICPVSQAQNEEELVLLQCYRNFRPLKHSDNIRKYSHKTVEAEQMCRELLGRNWIEKD